MTIKLALLILSLTSIANAATPIRFESGGKGSQKIKFAFGLVNGTTYWKQSEYNNAIVQANVFSGTTPVVSNQFIPSNFEVTLITGTLSDFNTPEDFNEAQTQAGIMPYLDELYVRIRTLTDSSQNAKAAKSQANYDFLSSQAKILP